MIEAYACYTKEEVHDAHERLRGRPPPGSKALRPLWPKNRPARNRRMLTPSTRKAGV